MYAVMCEVSEDEGGLSPCLPRSEKSVEEAILFSWPKQVNTVDATQTRPL